LTVLFFVTGAISPAFLEGNGTSFNFGPGEHGWIITGSRVCRVGSGLEPSTSWNGLV
jgi:hypothetical protein